VRVQRHSFEEGQGLGQLLEGVFPPLLGLEKDLERFGGGLCLAEPPGADTVKSEEEEALEVRFEVVLEEAVEGVVAREPAGALVVVELLEWLKRGVGVAVEGDVDREGVLYDGVVVELVELVGVAVPKALPIIIIVPCVVVVVVVEVVVEVVVVEEHHGEHCWECGGDEKKGPYQDARPLRRSRRRRGRGRRSRALQAGSGRSRHWGGAEGDEDDDDCGGAKLVRCNLP